YLAGLAAGVTVLTRSPDLRAGAARQERALAHPGIEVRHGMSVEAILGSDRVEAVALTDAKTGRRETLPVDGVVVRVGSEPSTGFLVDAVELEPGGQVVTGAGLETSAPGVLAAGDVRRGARPRVVAAVEDGTAAALRAREI